MTLQCGAYPLAADNPGNGTRTELSNLKSAVSEAINRNPEVRLKWDQVRSAAYERDATAGALKPRVDLDAGVGAERRDDPSVRDNYTRINSTLSLTQTLWDGQFTRKEVDRLDHATRVRLYELLEAAEGTAFEATRAHLDLMRHRKLVELAEGNYITHRAVFGQIQAKVKAGVGRGVDLETISGRLALSEGNLLTAVTNMHDVAARYQRIVGQLPPGVLDMPASLERALPNSRDSAVDVALRKNPSLLAAIENVRAADVGVKSRDAAFHPRVDFRLRHDQGRNLSGVIGEHRNSVAELILNYNFYRGGADQARQQQAVADKYIARDQRDKVCRDVRQTMILAYNESNRLLEMLGYLDRHQLSVEKAQQAYVKQFEIGQRSLLDMLDTENEVFQARNAYVNGEFDLLVQRAKTLSTAGVLIRSLGVDHQMPEESPGLSERDDERPDAEWCPPMPLPRYLVNKEELDAKAVELMGTAFSGQGAGGGNKDSNTVPKPATPPAALTARAATGGRVVSLATSALFRFADDTLLPTGQLKINLDVLAKLNEFKRLDRVSIVGHTDPLGSPERNVGLSERRANAVKEYLVSKGVDAQIIQASGVAATQPVPNVQCSHIKRTPKNLDKLAQCMQPHRRIEVRIEGAAK